MNRTIRQIAFGLMATVILTLSGPAASTAMACPMCKAASEEDDAKPRAYMYSILFMLTVPATIFSGLTFGLFVIGRREEQALLEAGLIDDIPVDPASDAGQQADPQTDN